MNRTLGALLLAAALVVAGCTSKDGGAPTGSTVPTTSATSTAPQPTGTPAAPSASFTAVAPPPLGNVPPGSAPPAGEVKGDCPYISTADAQQAQGNHIYLTTVSAAQPVVCRFYFYAPPYNAVLEIAPQTFANATDAHNAMVLTAQATTRPDSLESFPNFAPGVDLISFQTNMYAPDNGADWAAAFSKGPTMVRIRTQQNNVSQDARNVAQLIVDKF